MPSMSYCQMENTSHEMRAILRRMQEVNTIAELKLRATEAECFEELAVMCKRFLSEVERLQDGAFEDDSKYGYIDADDLI